MDSSGVGGLNDIYPIQNLSREAKVSVEAGMLLCRALQAALYAAVDYLQDQPDTMEPDATSAYTAAEVSVSAMHLAWTASKLLLKGSGIFLSC